MNNAAAQSAARLCRGGHIAIPPGWMQAAEAARVKGLTPRTIRMRCAAGQLDAVRGGDGRWYVNPNCDPALKLAAGLFHSTSPTSPTSPTETIPALAGSPLAGISAAKRDGIARKYRAVQAYLVARENKPADMTLPKFERVFVAAWNARHPDVKTSRTTLLSHAKALREGGIAALMDNRDYHGPASISPGAWDFLLGLYCSENRHHIAAIYERAAALAEVEGWRLPSLRTVQRLIAGSSDPRIIALGRTPKLYRDRMLPTALRDWSQIPAMGLWVADHRLLDIWVPRRWYDSAKKRDRVTWQRPWLTLYMDARSWKPTAHRIAWDSPNAQRVMATFIDGVSEHGCPEALYLDNGKDFRAHAFAGGRPRKGKGANEKLLRADRVGPLLEMLGVTAHWALPYNARAKTVERFFGIMAERFDKCWDTYCGNSPANTPEQLKGLLGSAADYEQVLSLETIQQAFDGWLIDDYCLRQSPAAACRGLSVNEAFAQLRDEDFVRRVPPAEDLMLLCLPSRRQKVGPNGIFVTPFQRHYDCEAFAPLRCSNKRVTYRYNAADPSVVYVFDAESDTFIAAAGVYAGERLHPLAATGSDDAERLADVMAARNRQAREDTAELKRLKALAANVMLKSQADAAKALGLHLAAPGTKPKAAKTATVIPLVAGGQLSKAAAAGRKQKQRQEQTRRAAMDAAAFLETGTDAADQRPSRVSVYDILPAAEDGNDGQNGDA